MRLGAVEGHVGQVTGRELTTGKQIADTGELFVTTQLVLDWRRVGSVCVYVGVCKTRAQGKESVVGAAGDVNAAMGTSLRRAHRSRDNRAEAVGGKDLTPIVRTRVLCFPPE